VSATDELTKDHGSRHGVPIFGDASIFREDHKKLVLRRADECIQKVLLQPGREEYVEEWRQAFLEETAYYLSSHGLWRSFVEDFDDAKWSHIAGMTYSSFIKRVQNIVDARRAAQARLKQQQQERESRKLYPGKVFTIWVNQGYRDATTLAVIGDEALIEYVMPRGTTALRIVDAYIWDGSKTVSYKNVPRKWLKEIEEAGIPWEGNSQ